MKVMIEIPEYLYEAILEYPNVSGLNVSTLESAVLHGTPIPDNATNGDVIKAMFNCLEKYEYEEPYTHGIALAGNDNRVTWFANDWWNNPYQKGGKE